MKRVNELKALEKAYNDTFIKGRCFVCLSSENLNPEALCHFVCALAYTKKKEEINKKVYEEIQKE